MSVLRTFAAALLFCALALGVFMAPVAGATPQSSEFSQAVPGSGARETVLRPGREFELVGFRWRGARTPKLSVQSYGTRGWSDWVEIGAAGRSSDPVWTGASSKLRVRVDGTVRGLTAHFVHVRDPASNLGPRISSTGGAAPTAGAAPSTGGPPAQKADAPAIVGRAQWGASRCKPRATPNYGEVLAAVVHHTESTNSYSRSEAPSVVLGICLFHRNTRKWNDIGYNLLIDRFGTVYEGRGGGVDRAVVGAHSQGYNSQTTGVALLGGFGAASPPQAALDSLRRVLNWKLTLAGVTRNERVGLVSTGGSSNRFKYGQTVFSRPVSGHRDLDSTACPGGELYAQIPAVSGFLSGGSRPATRMSFRIKRVPLGNGQAVRASGRLTLQGAALSGKAVSVQAFTSTGWVTLADVTTDDSGIWQSTVQPKGRYYLRAMFAGDNGHRPIRTLWRFSPKLKRG